MWKYKSAKRAKEEFLVSHPVQTDTEFLKACGNPGASGEAIAVRKAIAVLGGVEAERIHASDAFTTDLINLDFWGSLDAVAVIYELEKQLNRPITNDQAARIPNPEIQPSMTVADFVNAVLKMIDA